VLPQEEIVSKDRFLCLLLHLAHLKVAKLVARLPDPAAPGRRTHVRIGLRKRSVFECFPYGCPEPVLVKRSHLYTNGYKIPFAHRVLHLSDHLAVANVHAVVAYALPGHRDLRLLFDQAQHSIQTHPADRKTL
jgi:hypothetical protein